MTITDNLISDISNAPEWFLKSIANKGVDVLINDPNGDISYSKWKSNNQSKNLDLKKYFISNFNLFSEKNKKIILDNY